LPLWKARHVPYNDISSDEDEEVEGKVFFCYCNLLISIGKINIFFVRLTLNENTRKRDQVFGKTFSENKHTDP
jgi:hypothetical protein